MARPESSLSTYRPAGSQSLIQRADVNVSETERWASLAAGGGLLLAGLLRGRFLGTLLAIAGGGLIYRGLTGHCHVYEALRINTAEHVMD